MPELDYLDLAEDHGAIVQKRGTATVEQLVAEAGLRSDAPAADLASRIRLLMRSRQALRHAVAEPHAIYMHRAIRDTLQTLRHSDLERFREPMFLKWSGHSPVQWLAGSDFADSLDVFLRNADDDEVLVEVKTLAPEALAQTERTYERFYGDVMDQLIAQLRGRTSGQHTDEDQALRSMEEDSAALRTSLSRDWPKAADVSRALGSTAANSSQLATRLRSEGQLLGVYIPSPNPHYRFPRWQFKPDGQPVPHFAEILQVLREDGPFLDDNRRTTGWGEVEWFLAPHVLLDDLPPADVLATDPARVLAAARAEFQEDA